MALNLARPLGAVALAVCFASIPAVAHAQAAAPAGLEPPKLVTRTAITYPANAPKHEAPITVRVSFKVGPDGKVRHRFSHGTDPETMVARLKEFL